MDADRHLLELPGDAPEAKKTTRLDRKMPQPGSRYPGLFQSSQATVLELWASPELQTSLDAARHLLEPPGDAPEAQKTTRLDRKMPQSRSRHPGFFQSSQATVLELWASPDLLRPPWTQLDTSWTHLETPKKHRKRPNLTGKCLNQEVVIEASSRALRPQFWALGFP